MNFSNTKNFSRIVTETLEAVEAAEEDYSRLGQLLPYELAQVFVAMRLTLAELNAYNDIDKEITKQVIDTYIPYDYLMKMLKTSKFLSKESQMDFIKADLGNAYTMLQGIKLSVYAIHALSHPEEHSDRFIKATLDGFLSPILQDTPQNQAVWSISLNRVEKINEQLKQQEQDNDLEELKNLLQKQAHTYEIENDKLLFVIYDYLVSTDVLSEAISFTTFAIAISKADISEIHPTNKYKFTSSLRWIGDCITFKKRQWLRDVCASINITPRQASSNNTNLKEWYEELCDIVSKYSKK